MTDDVKIKIDPEAPPEAWLNQAKTLSEALPYMRR